MKKQNILLVLAVFLYSCVAGSSSAAVSTQPAELFDQVTAASPGAGYSVSGEALTRLTAPGEKRVRKVSVNKDLLAEKVAKNLDEVGQPFWEPPPTPIIFNLFADAVFTIVCDRLESRSAKGFAWFGHIQGENRSQVILIVEDDIISGNVRRVDGSFFKIRAATDDLHEIVEFDEGAVPTSPFDAIASDYSVPTKSDPGTLQPSPASPSATFTEAAANGPVQIDIMVLYTFNTFRSSGNETVLKTEIALGIASANAAYANSAINQELRLVYTGMIDYTESGTLRTDIDKIRNLTEVIRLRELFGADLVCTIIEYGDMGGLGYINKYTFESESTGFSLIKYRNHTTTNLTHEFGHNMGAGHERDNPGGAVGAFDFSHGRRFTAGTTEYRTIMSYAPGVVINYFANPQITYSGEPTGVTSANLVSGADNARTLNLMAPLVASFRPSVPPITRAGSLELNACSPWAKVILRDSDLTGQGTTSISVVTDSGDNELVAMTEFPILSGVFIGTLPIDSRFVGQPVVNDGILQGQLGNLMTGRYEDDNNGLGLSEFVEIAASLDCRPAIRNGSLPETTRNTAYSEQLHAEGGTGHLTLSLAGGVLPPGMALTNNTLTGTPQAIGSYTFSVQVTDEMAFAAVREFTLTINEPAEAYVFPCSTNLQCGENRFCRKEPGDCDGIGSCAPMPEPDTTCDPVNGEVCGCDGNAYANSCVAAVHGVNTASTGTCGGTNYRWRHYFPFVVDVDEIGWENYLTVQAREPVSMDVKITVYDLTGAELGKIIYSDTDPAANAAAIVPYARVAKKPSEIAGKNGTRLPVRGSVIVETSVPAIASTNVVANRYNGFSIYESAKVRPVHLFPKNYDGPTFFKVSILVQNIYDSPRSVTLLLLGKTPESPGHGAHATIELAPFATLKIRPSAIAGDIDFNGSVMVYSNQSVPGDGLGPPIPAMNCNEVGSDALALYESTFPEANLFFPHLRDGKFGGSLDYQNFLSFVNPANTTAMLTMVLYNNSGAEEARKTGIVIPPNGKITWRPSWIKGNINAPVDFAGSVVIYANTSVVGQTNTIYPGTNAYGTNGFDLVESSLVNGVLFFPKAYDNLPADNYLTDNYLYIQNPDALPRNIKIEQFNNNGAANGLRTVTIDPHATHVYQPKDLVTDGTGKFRGSVRITELEGRGITGVIKYEVHNGPLTVSPVTTLTMYRSMGQ